MNKSHLEHAIAAAAIQAAFLWVIGPWASGAVAVAIFLGREIAQNEYGVAVSRGWKYGEKPPVKWYEGLTKGWDTDAILDVATPALVCSGAAFAWSTLF